MTDTQKIKEIKFLLELADNPISRIKRLREIVSAVDTFDSLFPQDQICQGFANRFQVMPKSLGLACAKNFLEQNKMLYFNKELNK